MLDRQNSVRNRESLPFDRSSAVPFDRVFPEKLAADGTRKRTIRSMESHRVWKTGRPVWQVLEPNLLAGGDQGLKASVILFAKSMAAICKKLSREILLRRSHDVSRLPKR